MSRKTFVYFVFFISFFSCTSPAVWCQRSDTLYMNAGWQICEKPFASYYRFGNIVIDTFWFYSGTVTDYYMNDTLEMEGNYSAIGEKEGFFTFYYPDGKTKASGKYSNNRMQGIWNYYHRNGKQWLKINYAGDDINYTVLDYIDSSGKVLAKNGTGDFEMEVTHTTKFLDYRLEGEFKNGKRDGTWKYYRYVPIRDREEVMIKEIYEDGVLKKGTIYGNFSALRTYKNPEDKLRVIDFPKLKATERFTKDLTSFTHRMDDQDLLDYLVKRETSVYDMEGESFEESFTGVLKKLNTPTVLRYFSDPKKIYSGLVTLNLSDSGDIEDIVIQGNLSAKEEEYMLFFFRKFKNIHDLMIENVSIDTYHKIYFYSVIFSEIVPKRFLSNFPDKQFYFAPLPYHKFKEAIKTQKKKEKNS